MPNTFSIADQAGAPMGSDPASQQLAMQLASKVTPTTSPDNMMSMVKNEDGSTDYYMEDPESELTDTKALQDVDHRENLARYLPDEVLEELAEEVMEGYEADERSREGYIDEIVDAIRLIKSTPDTGASDKPHDGACDVTHPVILEFAVKLQSRASNELLPANGPVKAKLVQVEDEDEATEKARIQKAGRIQRHMNWQLTKEIEEYYKNSERAFLVAAAFGDCFKRKYYDRLRGRLGDTLVTPDRLVVNARAESLTKADRITEIIYMNDFDFASAQEAGAYIGFPNDPNNDFDNDGDKEVTLESDVGTSIIQMSEFEVEINSLLGIFAETFEGHKLLEQRAFFMLPGDEDPKPYIITVHEASRKVVAVYRDWYESDPACRPCDIYSHYSLVPGPGFYSMGGVHLLGSSAKTMTAIMRLLIDSGENSSIPMLVKVNGTKINGDKSEIKVERGTVWDIDVPTVATGQNPSVRDFIDQIQFGEPSPTLFSMLQYTDGRSQQFADSIENVLDGASNYGPVGTTMALLDNAAKFFAAIHKRLHKSQAKELEIISKLNFETMPEDATLIAFNQYRKTPGISKDDYNPGDIDIIPVSDPNVSSQAHRLAIEDAKMTKALQAPQLHDMRAVYTSYYLALGVENPDKLLPGATPAQPLDPIGDIVAANQGKPIQAFPEQDHQAHIAVKNAFLNDPNTGSNPAMSQVAAAIQANVREHMIFLFQSQMQAVQQATGLDVSQAAAKYTEFAKYQASGGAESPEMMAAQAALKDAQTREYLAMLKDKDIQRQAAKDAGDLTIKDRELDASIMKTSLSQALAIDAVDQKADERKTETAIDMLMQVDQQAHEIRMAKLQAKNKQTSDSAS